jgi:tRNA 2-thiouridine synthesizing protein D
MKFALAIYAPPFSAQASYTAFQFATAALTKGHSIYRVFFYHDGAHHGSRLHCPPQDELDLTKAWQLLAEQYQIDMVVCIAAGLRRGVLNAVEAQRYTKDTHNLHSQFELSGLGQLVDAAVNADRLLTFGA